MQPTHKLSKEQVRKFMAERQAAHAPPPSLEEVRRQLGWPLIEAEREAAR